MKNYIALVSLQVCDESMLLNRPLYWNFFLILFVF